MKQPDTKNDCPSLECDPPILETMRSIYSAVPMHHLAAIHGKLAGSIAVATAITDAIPLIHGPVGCSFQRKLNPFTLASPFYDTPCTNLNNVDVVYGSEAKLSKGIIETYERYKPRLIVVLTTCTTDLIGDDIPGAVETAKEKVGCDVVYSTGDFVAKARTVGVQDSLYAIADQLICEQKDVVKNEGSVNLINSALQRDAFKFQEMSSLLSQMGIKTNKMLFNRTTTQDLLDLARGDLNITVTRAVWTEVMKKKMNIEHCNIRGWDRYTRTKDPAHMSPFGIAGSCRMLEEIARLMGREGEAEQVIREHRTATEQKLDLLTRDLKGVNVAAPVGFSLNLLKDAGVNVAVLTHRTQTLTHTVTDRALQEIERANTSLANIYGYEPEVLINPTPEDEIKIFKKRKVDLVIAGSRIAHLYNRHGIRTVDLNDFSLRQLNVGFLPSLTLCYLFRNALGTVKKRSPLLNLIEFDDGIRNLTPHWAKVALSFHHIRSKQFKKGSYSHYRGLAGVELEHDL
jgi:nitrogenase molybdenum-iron protein alpha/beta subunit